MHGINSLGKIISIFPAFPVPKEVALMPLEIKLLLEVPIISTELDSIFNIPPFPAPKVFIPIEEFAPILNSFTTKLRSPASPSPKVDVPNLPPSLRVMRSLSIFKFPASCPYVVNRSTSTICCKRPMLQT